MFPLGRTCCRVSMLPLQSHDPLVGFIDYPFVHTSMNVHAPLSLCVSLWVGRRPVSLPVRALDGTKWAQLMLGCCSGLCNSISGISAVQLTGTVQDR